MKKKTMDFIVIMSGPHEIPVGKKVHIRRDDGLFYVSSEGQEFGLLKESVDGTLEQVSMLAEKFEGIVVDNSSEDWQIKIRVPLKAKKHLHSSQSL